MTIFNPSPAQNQVLALTKGVHIVLAPPGSGKTELLATRVTSAIAAGQAGGSMLCVTFTNRAARNMRSRIGEIKGRKPFVGTLHNFGLRFLFANRLIPANTVLLDEEDASQMLRDAQYSVLENSRGEMERKIPVVSDYVRAYNQRRLKLDAITKRIPADAFLEEVAAQYEQMKAASCSIDFDDALHLMLHSLMHTQPEKLRSFPWVQVDEVQDLSTLQWEILHRLVADDAHVVYFGDYDQAIFSFMGASHKALTKFTADATVHHLTDNFRSPEHLIEVFNAYARDNLPSRRESLRVPTATARSGGLIHIHAVSGTFDDEAQSIAQKIVPELAKNHGTVAVLTRTNDDAETVSRHLLARCIDHFKVSGFDLFRRRAIKDVMALLRARQFPADRHAWTRLLSVFGGVDTLRASREMVSELFEAGLNPADLLDPDSSLNSVDRFSDALAKGRCVVFDTETTGLNPASDDIVQIAAAELIDGVPTGREFEIFLKTRKNLAATTTIHGITKEILSQRAVPAAAGLKKFLAFAGDAFIAGHNVNFDLAILQGNLARAELEWEPANGVVDTLPLARRLHPRLANYKLGFLLEALQLPGENSHDAIDDVRATVNLMIALSRTADAGQAERQRLVKQYRKYLQRFAKSLRPIWTDLSDRLDREANLAELVELFFFYAVKETRYLLAEDERKHVDTLINYLEANTPRRPIRRLLASLVPELSTYSEGDLITGGEKVVVSTIHKAKGLQFEGVIVTSCVDEVYPHYFAKKKCDVAAIEEDARLLYVAMTRAQRTLVVSLHDTAINRGGTFPRWPSPFIAGLRKESSGALT